MKHSPLLIFFIAAVSLTACQGPEMDLSTSISGEIVNAKSPYIIILKNDEFIDTVPLNKNHHFSYQFGDDFENGLYTFRHPYAAYSQSQMFYLEAGDSLRLRLNTRDFDQSLMYTGEGAVKNNFLMRLFLAYRENNDILPHYYTMNPDEFDHKVDSIKQVQLRQLEHLGLKYGFSSDFTDLAKSIITYACADFHERYYFLVNKYSHQLQKQLPSNFLAYRENVDFNDKSLQTYYLYQYFLYDYLKNRAAEICLTQENRQDCFNMESRQSLKERLRLSDELFKLKSLRTRALTRYAAGMIVRSQRGDQVDSIIDFLTHTTYGEDGLQRIKDLANVQKRQFIGNVSQLYLTAFDGESTQISSLLNQPTVFYYWSIYYKAHHQRLHKRMQTLRKHFPQLNFIGINIDNNKTDLWKSGLTNFGYNRKFEFQLVCPIDERMLYRNYLNKIVFIDKDGNIIDSQLQAFDTLLEEKLLGLLNREEQRNGKAL